MSGLQLYTRSNLELLFDFDFSTRDADKSAATDAANQYSVFSHVDNTGAEVLLQYDTDETQKKSFVSADIPLGNFGTLLNSNYDPSTGTAKKLNDTFFYFINTGIYPDNMLDLSYGFYLNMDIDLKPATNGTPILHEGKKIALIQFRDGGPKTPPAFNAGIVVELEFPGYTDNNSFFSGKLFLNDLQEFPFESRLKIVDIQKLIIEVYKINSTEYQLIFKVGNQTLIKPTFEGKHENGKYPVKPFEFQNRLIGIKKGGAPEIIYSMFPGTINKFKFTPYTRNQSSIKFMEGETKQQLFKQKIYDIYLLRPSYYYNFKKTKLIDTTNIGGIIGVNNSGVNSTSHYGNLKKFDGNDVSNSAQGDLNKIKSKDGANVDSTIAPILKEGENNNYYYDLEQDLASKSKDLTLDLRQGFAIKMKMDLSSLTTLPTSTKIGLLNMRTDTQGFKIALEIPAAAGAKGKLILWEDTNDSNKNIKVDLQTELDITKLVTIKEILILAYPDFNNRRLFVWIKYQDTASLETAANNIIDFLIPPMPEETAKKTAILDLGKKAFSSVPDEKETSIKNLAKVLEPNLFTGATNDKYLNSSFVYFKAADITSDSDSQKKTAASAAIGDMEEPYKLSEE